jgi:hypothetical protein
VLDLEQSRVKDCIDRVQSAAELKDAFHQLFQAIEYADWEAATRHVQRANAIDRAFLTSHFVEAVVVSPKLSISLFSFPYVLIIHDFLFVPV